MKSDKSISVGVNYRAEISKDILNHIDEIDFFEIYSEKFLLEEEDITLNKIMQLKPFAFHGLDMSLGSDEQVDLKYLINIIKVVNSKKPLWFSDHLSMTKQNSIEVGHLMPIQFTEELAEQISTKIKQFTTMTKIQFLVENITYYYSIPGSNLSEAQFITTIVENADCGLLLDINNLYINSVNHKYDPRNFLQNIPLERVVEIHLAGGSKKFNRLIDTHANAISNEVWQLFDYVLALAPVQGVIIERDANLSDYNDLLAEVRYAKKLIRERK